MLGIIDIFQIKSFLQALILGNVISNGSSGDFARFRLKFVPGLRYNIVFSTLNSQSWNGYEKGYSAINYSDV